MIKKLTRKLFAFYLRQNGRLLLWEVLEQQKLF